MDPIALQVVIPFHQPINKTPEQLDDACQRCYFPLVDAIDAATSARVAVHFSGHLLDHFARRHEPFLMKLKAMAAAGKIEILGGLFYGGIPELLPENDVRGQIEMMSEYWQSIIGEAPTGFWLPESAWGPEVPRLLQDSELQYGFAYASQLAGPEGDGLDKNLGVVERGDERVGVFAIDGKLSRGLPLEQADSWVDALIDRAGQTAGRVMTAVVHAESLGLAANSHTWCFESGWLEQWLAAIGGDRAELRPVLPSESFAKTRPAVAMSLRAGCAQEIGADARTEGPADWTDFSRQFAEAEVLYQRMLQVSAKLREAIGTMEDEELEDEWSDTLATAQRMVFAAQTHDAYWRGATPGFSDPAIRDATVGQLSRANAMLDELVQGTDDWIATEEEDRDRDLVDEVFVSTARMSVWVVPARGGEVRYVEQRDSEHNIVDVGTRYQEVSPSASSPAVASAPVVDATVPDGVPKQTPRKAASAIDTHVRRGIRTWFVEGNTSPMEFDAGDAVSLLEEAAEWRVLENGIDEEGDCSYRLTVRANLPLKGLSPRTLDLDKTVTVPIDASEVIIRYDARLKGEPEVAVATEIPVRLPGYIASVVANGTAHTAEQTQLYDVSELVLSDEVGGTVTVVLSQPSDVWVMPVVTAVRGLEGRNSVSQGAVIAPILRVEKESNLTITLRLDAPTVAHGHALDDEEQEVDEEVQADPDDGDTAEHAYQEEPEADGEEGGADGTVRLPDTSTPH